MAFTGRTKPYRTLPNNTYICKRCGIQRQSGGNTSGYCIDCTHQARRMGWTD